MSRLRWWSALLAVVLTGAVCGDEKLRYAIAVHGGAGSSPENFSAEANRERHAGIRRVPCR